MLLIWFSIKHCMAHYLDFKGTTSREIYWKFVASVFLLWVIMGIFIGDGSAPYDWDAIVFLFSIIPVISATVRRIRNAGFNPWWGLLLAGPGTQVIVIIMAMFRTHTQQNGERQTYIPNPELNQNIELLKEQIVQLGLEISRLQREHSTTQLNDENRQRTSNVLGSNHEESMRRATLETAGELRHVDFLQSLPLEVHADSVIHDNSSLASDEYQCDVGWLKGTYTYPDGARYEGDWESDLHHGKGTYTHSDGSQLEGHWIHGAEMGTFIFTSVDGSKAYVEYDFGEIVSAPRTYIDPRGPWKDFR